MVSAVKVEKQSSVKPAGECRGYDDPSYPLGALDQPVAAFIPVAVVFVYPHNSNQETISSDRLTRALELVLDYYPFLSGRLHLNDDNSHSVKQLDAGADFIQATCDHSLSSFYHSSAERLTLAHLPSDGNDLLCPFDPMKVYDEPIVSIQHTRFACGSVSLGVRALHKVVDAIGIFAFVRDLLQVYSRLSAGDDITPRLRDPPCLSAYASSAAASVDLTSDPMFYTTSALTPPLDAPATPMTVTGRFLHASTANLDDLKRQASTEDKSVSTFVALTSFLYQCTHKARLALRQHDPSIPPLSLTHYLTSVNVRSSLGLNNYAHNALLTPHTHIPPSTLASAPLSQVATYIHDMVRSSLAPSIAGDTANWIAAQADKAKVRSTFEYGSGAFMTSAWNRIDMYGQGFMVDGVKPVLVSTPFTAISLVDGLGYFLPTRRAGDGLEVCLALDDRVWDLLKQDTRWVSVFGQA